MLVNIPTNILESSELYIKCKNIVGNIVCESSLEELDNIIENLLVIEQPSIIEDFTLLENAS